MGIGYPLDIVVCSALGADMYDSVYPTRTARFGVALGPQGVLKLKNAQYAEDFRCACFALLRPHIMRILRRQRNFNGRTHAPLLSANRSVLQLSQRFKISNFESNYDICFPMQPDQEFRSTFTL